MKDNEREKDFEERKKRISVRRKEREEKRAMERERKRTLGGGESPSEPRDDKGEKKWKVADVSSLRNRVLKETYGSLTDGLLFKERRVGTRAAIDIKALQK